MSFCSLIALARTSNTMFNESVTSGHRCFVPDLRARTLFLTIEHDASCGLVIYDLSYIEKSSLCAQFVDSFCYEWILNFVQCFSWICRDDHTVFNFHFMWCIILIFFDCCWSGVLLATSCLFYICICNFIYLNETFHTYGCQVHMIIIIVGRVKEAAREGLILRKLWSLFREHRSFRSKTDG